MTIKELKLSFRPKEDGSDREDHLDSFFYASPAATRYAYVEFPTDDLPPRFHRVKASFIIYKYDLREEKHMPYTEDTPVEPPLDVDKILQAQSNRQPMVFRIKAKFHTTGDFLLALSVKLEERCRVRGQIHSRDVGFGTVCSEQIKVRALVYTSSTSRPWIPRDHRGLTMGFGASHDYPLPTIYEYDRDAGPNAGLVKVNADLRSLGTHNINQIFANVDIRCPTDRETEFTTPITFTCGLHEFALDGGIATFVINLDQIFRSLGVFVLRVVAAFNWVKKPGSREVNVFYGQTEWSHEIDVVRTRRSALADAAHFDIHFHNTTTEKFLASYPASKKNRKAKMYFWVCDTGVEFDNATARIFVRKHDPASGGWKEVDGMSLGVIAEDEEEISRKIE
ncbi:hypothetical protein B0T16DRAFT_450797 [Cercophora newfieldiana]|uniref:Uncharacterized protein n=1 Tax=Cercophora newfieldiana TaxID=92897 RepID=A0AA40CZL5_9PEZI|nr:hypothetical protein B0T16DRAFT_450797 [Cercophora newfieldiana]